jgi:hypothetical protein
VELRSKRELVEGNIVVSGGCEERYVFECVFVPRKAATTGVLERMICKLVQVLKLIVIPVFFVCSVLTCDPCREIVVIHSSFGWFPGDYRPIP